MLRAEKAPIQHGRSGNSDKSVDKPTQIPHNQTDLSKNLTTAFSSAENQAPGHNRNISASPVCRHNRSSNFAKWLESSPVPKTHDTPIPALQSHCSNPLIETNFLMSWPGLVISRQSANKAPASFPMLDRKASSAHHTTLHLVVPGQAIRFPGLNRHW